MGNKINISTFLESKLDIPNLSSDSQFDAVFDSITDLVATVLNVPVALITFVDSDHIWIHSQVGYQESKVIPNRKIFCGMFPEDKEYFQIRNTDLDLAHRNHSFVIDGVKAKYYAGAKIKMPLDELTGILCVFDISERFLNVHERLLLVRLARIIEKILITKSFKKIANNWNISKRQ